MTFAMIIVLGCLAFLAFFYRESLKKWWLNHPGDLKYRSAKLPQLYLSIVTLIIILYRYIRVFCSNLVSFSLFQGAMFFLIILEKVAQKSKWRNSYEHKRCKFTERHIHPSVPEYYCQPNSKQNHRQGNQSRKSSS